MPTVGKNGYVEDTNVEPEGVRLKVHPGLCVGWGNCQRFGPEVYTLDDEGKVDFQLLDVPAELAYEAVGGAAACPNQAITVIGRQYDYWYSRRYGRRPLE